MPRALCAIVLISASLAGAAAAQEPYPTRPITIVAPFPPGGVVDLTARPFASVLERILKQPVVISNKPGAAGAVGRQVVAVAKPDGYTVLVDLVSISMVPEVDALFATGGASRHPAFPDAPTLKELGHDVEYYFWNGFFAPKNIPAHVLKTLRDAARRVVQDPEFKNAMAKAETVIAYQDADEFRGWWEKDAQALAAVIKQIGKIEKK